MLNAHVLLKDDGGRRIVIDVTPFGGNGALLTIRRTNRTDETVIQVTVEAADCAALAGAFEKGYAS